MVITELLTDLTIYFNALIRSKAARINLTASQALHIISIPYQGISMSNLSKKLGLDSSTLTRNIQQLEKRNLVEKIQNPSDKRITDIFLTKLGTNTLKLIEKDLHKVNTTIIENLNLESQIKLVDLLEELVWTMDCINDK